MPATTPALGQPPSSSYIPCAVSKPTSRNDEPSSISAAIRSRAVSFPLALCRSIDFAPPPFFTASLMPLMTRTFCRLASALDSNVRSCSMGVPMMRAIVFVTCRSSSQKRRSIERLEELYACSYDLHVAERRSISGWRTRWGRLLSWLCWLLRWLRCRDLHRWTRRILGYRLTLCTA